MKQTRFLLASSSYLLILQNYIHNFNSLLAIGDKYNIKGLANLCERELSKNIELNNAINILEAADKVGADYLKSCAVSFVAANHRSLQKTSEWKKVVESDSELLSAILKLKL